MHKLRERDANDFEVYRETKRQNEKIVKNLNFTLHPKACEEN